MTDLVDELTSTLEASMQYHPRSMQKRIGPSEIGNPCDRCLAHKLAGTPERADLAWLPWIGTAVHERLELLFIENNNVRVNLGMDWRWLTESTVTVGTIGGVEITGSTDLFDPQTGTVVDYKCVGTSTLRKAKTSGPSEQYRIQANLYARGWIREGYTVNQTAIWYLPRNAMSLRDGYFWSAPVDLDAAEQALERANRLATAIDALGAQAVIDAQPEHTGDFTCKRWPDYAPPPMNPRDPFA